MTLLCTAMGGPNNSFYWEKNGTIIGNHSTVNLVGIDASKGGDYTCTVSNAAGSDSVSTTLYVAPYIITLEEQVLTVNGSNVNISCNADGFPAPVVTWINMLDVVVSNTSQLLFTSVLFGDEGVYYCVPSIEINGTKFSTRNGTTLISKWISTE